MGNEEKRLKKKEKKLQKMQRKKLKMIEEKQKKKNDEKKFNPKPKKIKMAKKEIIKFGETNDRPPINLHKLGSKLFGKKVRNQSDRNSNNLNVEGLSFVNIIKQRAHQMKKEEIMRNYAKI